MNLQLPMGNHQRFWRWYWGAWLSIALYFTLWDVAFYGDPLLPSLSAMVLQKAVLGILSLLVIRTARCNPLDGFRWRQWRVWGFQLTLCILVAMVGLTVNRFVRSAVDAFANGERFVLLEALKRVPNSFGGDLHWVLLLELFLLLSVHWISMEEKIRLQEVRTARLETDFIQAQHMALRTQLQPHFLFNTLNSLSQLVHKDPDSADHMIGRLGAFFRMTLDRAPKALQSLRDELEFIEAYLAIEHIRFKDRLQVCVTVPSELMEASIPSFILQPLVENAVKHGLSDKAEGGTIHILARGSDSFLEVEIIDDGLGYRSGREGTGLANTRSRLTLLFGSRSRIEILPNPEGGTRVVLRLPLAMEPACE